MNRAAIGSSALLLPGLCEAEKLALLFPWDELSGRVGGPFGEGDDGGENLKG